MYMTELVNYKKYSQSVFITVDVEFIAGRPDLYVDAQMSAISALGCAGPSYSEIPRTNIQGEFC